MGHLTPIMDGQLVCLDCVARLSPMAILWLRNIATASVAIGFYKPELGGFGPPECHDAAFKAARSLS
jgi:hypothetical protein